MINPGIDPKTGNPKTMWEGIRDGLLQGVASIGINYATQELGLNPLLANIGFSAISTAINAGMQVALGQIDPDTGKPIDYFKAIYNTYEKNALTFLGAGDPNNAWQQAAYIAQIQDFTRIATERGFVEALNTYGAGFFNAVAVNNIVQSGMSIGQYFASKLAAGQYTLKINPKTGTEYKEVGIGQDGEYGAGLFTGNQEIGYTLSGKTEEYGDTSFWGFGDVGVDAYGKMGFTDAELATVYNGIWRERQTINGGLQIYADVCDLRGAGQQLLTITPDELLGYNVYNSYGEYVDARVLSTITDMKLDINNGSTNNVTIGQGTGTTTLTMSGQDFSSLLFSAVEGGKIVLDKLIKQSTWQGLVGIAEAAENIASPLTDVANLAINRINSGQSVDLASLASTSVWQSIFATSGSMSDWANTATLLFANSISPALAPGTEMLMNLFGSETFREQLNSQAAETFNGYNLFEELASVALGNPGSGTIIEQIGAKSFWEGIKLTSELVWNNRNMIFDSMQDLTSLTLNPVGYLTDQFWASNIGQEFIRERDDFFCLTPPDTYISPIDPITKTLRVDPDLNYANLMQQPISGIMDLFTLVRLGNVRWDRASADAGAKSGYLQSYLLSGALKGVSYSGINDTGVRLDSLTKLIAPDALGSFVFTHSAGISSFLQSGLRPEMAMITSPQEKRINVENWIDKMGYTPDKILVVDTAGDLPYRPVDLVDLSLQDILNPANITNPANLLVTDVQNLVNNNAYHDYSQSPSKYTYMRIISGPGIDSDLDVIENHMVAFEGALNPNAEYVVSIDGQILEGKHKLKDLYNRFLRGDL